MVELGRSIEFNAKGQVVDYKRLASGTSRTCGGDGKTPWNSLISCEEIEWRGGSIQGENMTRTDKFGGFGKI